MNRRGFALLGALWLVVAIAVLLGAGFARLRVGAVASRNRLALARGRWAAEACQEIARGRWGTDRWRTDDSVDLGRGTRCRWHVTDPSQALNLNTAPGSALTRLFIASGISGAAARSLADSIVARRGARVFFSVDEAAQHFGLPAAVCEFLTVDGFGSVNPALAPRPVLLALPGFGAEAAAVLEARRSGPGPVTSIAELVPLLSPPARSSLLAVGFDADGLVRFESPVLTVVAEGWVATATPSPRARIEQMVAAQSTRLGVLRRRIV